MLCCGDETGGQIDKRRSRRYERPNVDKARLDGVIWRSEKKEEEKEQRKGKRGKENIIGYRLVLTEPLQKMGFQCQRDVRV